LEGYIVRLRPIGDPANPVGKAEVVSSILTGSTILSLIDPSARIGAARLHGGADTAGRSRVAVSQRRDRMTDDRQQAADYPVGPVDASGEPLGEEQVLPPEQPPMDDAAGGPQAESDPGTRDTPTEDLSVQGGD
jgi:hypothetical protein